MEPKAIQDEMGEVFDDYGRMSAKLGLELAFTNAGIQTFILQNFVDPPTENLSNGEVQIWKITHNGVDTHPVHFHLFEVQVLNRVGWDGFIYLPDANELGWKDTVRISPLEDTIVAVRAKAPTLPFPVPESIRPLNPAFELGSTQGFSNIDPFTGQPTTTVNQMTNFGWEYVWHCHILSHEESDMMRPMTFRIRNKLFWRSTPGQANIWDLDYSDQLRRFDALWTLLRVDTERLSSELGRNGEAPLDRHLWAGETRDPRCVGQPCQLPSLRSLLGLDGDKL